MDKVMKKRYAIFIWLGGLLFVSFYPMLISIYVFLPLFIGAMSYLLIVGLDKPKPLYTLLALFYMVNLEVNLSLPTFLMVIITLLFYVIVYPYLRHFRKCKICKPLLSVILLDLAYLGALFAYDFIFQTQTIVLDSILFYSLIVDMLIVVIL
jgi:hypothetical protein